jgi:AraC family transcriptional regulator, regulatory protein of adaptative response / methylated-DNA-[protein]-cysteine methyltransferase
MGVCSIDIGDDPQTLVYELADRFPRAELVGGDAKLDRMLARVAVLIEKPGGGERLRLDIRGTAFQRRVWEAIRAIPPGATASYAEIAQRIGQPRAARAVAGACGSCHLSVAIPCHRVVRADGTIAGSHRGIEVRRALLRREGME